MVAVPQNAATLDEPFQVIVVHSGSTVAQPAAVTCSTALLAYQNQVKYSSEAEQSTVNSFKELGTVHEPPSV